MSMGKHRYHRLLTESLQERSVTDNRFFTNILSVPCFEKLRDRYIVEYPEESHYADRLVAEAYNWLWEKFCDEVSRNLSDNLIENKIYGHTITQFFQNLQNQKNNYQQTHDKIYSYSLSRYTSDEHYYNPNDNDVNIFFNTCRTDIGQWNQAAESAFGIISMGENVIQDLQENNHSFFKWQQVDTVIKQDSAIDTEKQRSILTINEPPESKNPTQSALAMFYFFSQHTGEMDAFKTGKMEQEYERVVKPYGLSAKSFQQHYNRLNKRENRKKPENRKALLEAIQLLQNYPKALSMAKDELNTAKIGKPLT